MIIPKHIQIAGKAIEIKVDHKYCMENKIYGASLYDKNTIILDDHKVAGFSEDKIKQVLLHEVIHFSNAILCKNGHIQDEEDYVNPLSELLYQVFKQIESKNKTK